MTKDIPGYEGFYSVDEFGNVFSMYNNRYGKRKTPRKITPTPNKGRLYVSLMLNKTRRNWFISQLVLLTFVGPRPKGMDGCHGARGISDNSLSNLYYATHKQNCSKDRIRDGTMNWGERNGMSRLNEMQVRVIRRLRGIMTQDEIGGIFGVSQGTVSELQIGYRWGWLKQSPVKF